MSTNFPSYHPFRSAQAQAEYHALYMERSKSWPVPSETRHIETPTGLTFVRQSGSSSNPPLVLLPGSRGTSLSWIPNIAAFSAQYRTYALDSIYDFGLSVPHRKLKKREDLVAWLDEVLQVLVPQGSLNLLGLSYGGWLASQYALQFSERLHKVVFLAPAMTVLPVSFALICRALLSLIPLAVFRRQFYYWLLQDAVQLGQASRAWVDEAVADWGVAARCFAPLPVINGTVLDDIQLQAFKVPGLFLVGEHEKMYSAQEAVSRIHRMAPQIKAEMIPQTGHDLSVTQADLVNRKILDFLSDPE